MINISREEADKIREKYPNFQMVITGKLKENKGRKKYYIKPYILFSECDDVVSELEKYIDVYEMISRNDEAEICYQNFIRELERRRNSQRRPR